MVKKIIDGVFTLIFFCAVLGMIFFVIPRIFQMSPQIVLSGSMEPEIPTGSISYITRLIPPEEVKERDVIAYQFGEKHSVLHRVIRVEKEKKIFYTKGDANQAADLGKVEYTQYLGKQIFSIPYLGYAAAFFQKGEHVLYLAMGIAALILLDRVCMELETKKGQKRKGEGYI
ncbi:MAG: signal peptidase I [Clostridia bacterium]|nr:signal peptidase I [Clostridia bacterium]